MTRNYNAPGRTAYRVVYLLDDKEVMEREVFLSRPPTALIVNKWKEGLKRTAKGRPISIKIFPLEQS